MLLFLQKPELKKEVVDAVFSNETTTDLINLRKKISIEEDKIYLKEHKSNKLMHIFIDRSELKSLSKKITDIYISNYTTKEACVVLFCISEYVREFIDQVSEDIAKNDSKYHSSYIEKIKDLKKYDFIIEYEIFFNKFKNHLLDDTEKQATAFAYFLSQFSELYLPYQEAMKKKMEPKKQPTQTILHQPSFDVSYDDVQKLMQKIKTGQLQEA